MDVPPIRPRRLELVSLSPTVLEALLAGRRIAGVGPSPAIVRTLAFVRTGEHSDEEDGLEHVFELADGRMPS